MNRSDYERFALNNAEKMAVPSADNGYCFTDKRRLNEIEQELLNSSYKYVQKEPLYYLYSQKKLSETEGPVLVISTHADCLQPDAVFKDGKEKIRGIFDNAITNAAVLTLIKAEELPENVLFAFTGNEENGMRGAEMLTEDLRKAGIRFVCMVLDVTEEGWNEKASFTVENVFLYRKDRQLAETLLQTADNTGYGWKYLSARCEKTEYPERQYLTDTDYFPMIRREIPVYANKKGKVKEADPDETWKYDEAGISCFSLCIPCSAAEEKGGMHGENGFKIRKKTYFQYIETLKQVINALVPVISRNKADHKDREMIQQITNKLGFDIRSYSSEDSGEAHERDDIPSPFARLSLEELLFIRENNYFLPDTDN